MMKCLTGWKQEHPFLQDALSQPLQQAIHDIYDGWNRFFKGQNDKPTWRKHSDAPSFRLPQPDQWVIRNLPGTKKTTRHLFLPKMGMSGSLGPVAFVQHRPIEGKVKHLTIARDGGMWYVVGVEDLDTKDMTAAPGTVLADGSVKVPTVSRRDRKNMLDAGWAMTESLVRYKCARAGKMMVRVDPAYTSQGCSACKHVEKGNREGKVFICLACGHTMDADVNAGWNVRARAIAALVAEAKPKATKMEQKTAAGSAVVAPGGLHRGSAKGEERTVVVEGRQTLEKPQRAAAG